MCPTTILSYLLLCSLLILFVAMTIFLNTKIKPSPTSTTSYTTRYWDCEGGACGCGYQETANVKPTMCPSNAMVKAPLNNKYGAKFYGTAAVSPALFGNGSWQGRGCGKCYKLTGTSNVDTDRVTSTIILKATNLCPECAGDHYFDIAAPGFDTSSSGENHCKDSALDNNHGACSNWMGPKGSMNPSKDCDCNKIQDPTLRKGCENFLSLKWNNPYVQFEQVDCPPELGSKHPPCNTSGRWDIGLHGTCASSSPVVPKRECANIGDDVYDPNKFSKVPASCCTGAAAVKQDGKFLCL